MLRLILVSLLTVQKCLGANVHRFNLENYNDDFSESADEITSPAGINFDLSGNKHDGLEKKQVDNLDETSESPVPSRDAARESAFTPLEEVLSKFNSLKIKEQTPEVMRSPKMIFSPKSQQTRTVPAINEVESESESESGSESDSEHEYVPVDEKFEEIKVKNDNNLKVIKQNFQGIHKETGESVSAFLEPFVHKVPAKPAETVKVETVESESDDEDYDSSSDDSIAKLRKSAEKAAMAYTAANLRAQSVYVDEYDSAEEEDYGLSAGELMRRAEAKAKAEREAAETAKAEADAEAAKAAKLKENAEFAAAQAQKKLIFNQGKPYSGDLLSYDNFEEISELSERGRSELSMALTILFHDINNFESNVKMADIPESLRLIQVAKIVRNLMMKKLRKDGQNSMVPLLSPEELKSYSSLSEAVANCSLESITDVFMLVENLLRVETPVTDRVANNLIDKLLLPRIKSKNEDALRETVNYIATHGYVNLLKDLLANTGETLLSHLDLRDVGFILSTSMGNGIMSDEEAIEMIKLLSKRVGFDRVLRVYANEIAANFNKHRKGRFNEMIMN